MLDGEDLRFLARFLVRGLLLAAALIWAAVVIALALRVVWVLLTWA